MIRYALALALVATPAAAQPCGDSEEVRAGFTERYGEQPVITGTTRSGQLMRVWSAADHSTWTVTVENPDGMTCIVTVGERLRLIRGAAPAGVGS